MSAPQSRHLSIEDRGGGVALLTIERAARLNTLSVETLEELDAALRVLGRDERLRALVLTGAGGDAFAAGANIAELVGLSPREALAFAARGQRVFDLVERLHVPVFAAVDGFCMGGGLDLALACDFRHASTKSVFAHPGARLGILTGFGGTARLTRLVGRAVALEMFATGRRLTAADALAVGLVDRVTGDPVGSALAIAFEMADKWPAATAFGKGSALRWWRLGRSGR